MLGVRCFAWTSFIWCVYVVGAEQVREASGALWQQVGSKIQHLGDGSACFTGVSLCLSIMAIWNLILFEKYVSDILTLSKLKFWSGKLVVSLAYVQHFVIRGVGSLMRRDAPHIYYHQQLVYACLMCIEMLPLALLQLVAWDADQIEQQCILCRSAQGDGTSQQIEFTVRRRNQSMTLSIQEVQQNDKAFWSCASVALLSDGEPPTDTGNHGSVVQ